MDLRPEQVPEEQICCRDDVRTETGDTIQNDYVVEWPSVLDDTDVIEVNHQKRIHRTANSWGDGTTKNKRTFHIPESKVIAEVDRLEKEADTGRGWLTKVAIESIIKEKQQIQ
ncbi:hypothetical protein [Halorussus halophilus]|uniref:hypothetical protein n=1 Tax=Halorussus halophilus TaxID=2650975 RepID=UPI0013017BC2|nr:hypothetical protein [Halorussus halophilus]